MSEPTPGPAAVDNPLIPAWAGVFGDAPDGASLVAELAIALEQAGVDQAAGGLRFAVSRKRRPGDLSRGGRCGSITLDDLDAYGDLEEAIKAQWGGGLYLVRPAAPQEYRPSTLMADTTSGARGSYSDQRPPSLPRSPSRSSSSPHGRVCPPAGAFWSALRSR